MDFRTSREMVGALTAPRNVVFVGATDRPGAWAARVWTNFSRYGFQGQVYFLNPKRTEIFGQACHSSFGSLPESPDHLAVLVPAPGVIEALRAGAAAGARSATVFAAGFGEDGDAEGVQRRRELKELIARTGLAVSGPNVLGNLVGKSGLVTLTDPRPQTVRPGPLALVGQSGGVLIHINFVFQERGITPGYVLSSGNEVGLTMADYLVYFADEPEVKVILAYIEAIRDLERFKAACAYVRSKGKPVIAIKLGRSEAGQQAALAHTGVLAGSTEVFDAVAGELGVIRADTLDDAVELVELLLYTGMPAGRRLGAITLSGAYRGLLLDAGEKFGLGFPELAQQTQAHLEKLFTVGAKVSNPLDGGFGVLTSEETYLSCVDAIDADPNIDMLLLQEELPRGPGNDRTERFVRRVQEFASTRARKPVAFVSFATHSRTDYSRALRAGLPQLSFLNEPEKALRTIATAVRCAELVHLARTTAPSDRAAEGIACEIGARLRRRASTDRVILNEAQSKELVRAYGMATPREMFVASVEDAVSAADATGYPVVLKVVSSAISHKSDAGGVLVNLRTAAEVRAGYEAITRKLDAQGLSRLVEGMLICQHIGGGLELALGLHRDPEMGLVVMAGSGGVLVELIKDVAFAAPPISLEKARDLLERTRVARLLKGYRRAPARDYEAVVEGLVALGRMAADLDDAIESLDINPFVALARGEGALALDALAILARRSIDG